MTKTIKAVCVLLGFFCVFSSIIPQKVGINESTVMASAHEVKAVWAATIYNLDYPSRATTDSNVLKADIDRMINNVYSMGFNTLFFQVRPSSDAFYASDIYPWSKHLTGVQGLAPQNGFDPLGYAVEAAHAKGIDLHAWINPYRVTVTASEKGSQSANSIAKKYPELILEHPENGKLYLNPGEPGTNRLVIDGALEIIRKYNVDGIHLDDYFYPDGKLPDGNTHKAYGGGMSLDDWRRNNVTGLIRGLRDAIKAEKPHVVFSVSPFGIWANKKNNSLGSNTNGNQSYYSHYADTRKWVKEELVDWLIPQIYWEIGHNAADFSELAHWWNDVAAGTSVKVCLGQGIYRAVEATSLASLWYGQGGINELKRQTELLRSLDNIGGYAHYRLGSLTARDDLMNYAAEVNGQNKSLFNDTAAYPWAEGAIERLYKMGVVSGLGDGSFGCSLTVNRADFMVMLMRMMNKDVPFRENFSDVTPDKYYYKAVGTAKQLGYTNGRGNNIFDPMGHISRQDMAVLALRILESEGLMHGGNIAVLESKFTDANQIYGYARPAVAIMVENGCLNGYETGDFRPNGMVTRVEVAMFLNNILNVI